VLTYQRDLFFTALVVLAMTAEESRSWIRRAENCILNVRRWFEIIWKWKTVQPERKSRE
jgi:hypothetical protein